VKCEPTPAVIGVCADHSSSSSGPRAPVARALTIDLEPFAFDALSREATRLDLPVEELASYAVVYYLADSDSGRIARQVPLTSTLGTPHPLGKLLPG
jgi:hypothetical protein